MRLNPIAERFVLHWGEMGSSWGVNRTVAQIHALLFVVGEPMHADDIAQTLGVARSNVSTSLRELQSWKLVHAVRRLGDRKDYFATVTDSWVLFRTVVSGRKAREFDPTVDFLEHCVSDADFAKESPDAQARIRETLALMQTLSSWADEMLNLEPKTLMKILKLGAKIQNLIRSDKARRAGSRSEA